MILVPVRNLVDAKQGSLGCPRARTGLGLSSQLSIKGTTLCLGYTKQSVDSEIHSVVKAVFLFAIGSEKKTAGKSSQPFQEEPCRSSSRTVATASNEVISAFL